MAVLILLMELYRTFEHQFLINVDISSEIYQGKQLALINRHINDLVLDKILLMIYIYRSFIVNRFWSVTELHAVVTELQV